MKRTIAVKRAELYREWILATFANDGAYYDATLWTGIPDGCSLDDVFLDIKNGDYDDELDEMIAMYRKVKSRYGSSGWYYDSKLFLNEDEFIEFIHGVPEKIYLCRD